MDNYWVRGLSDIETKYFLVLLIIFAAVSLGGAWVLDLLGFYPVNGFFTVMLFIIAMIMASNADEAARYLKNKLKFFKSSDHREIVEREISYVRRNIEITLYIDSILTLFSACYGASIGTSAISLFNMLIFFESWFLYCHFYARRNELMHDFTWLSTNS